MPRKFLMQVEQSVSLTGLGVLLLPQQSVPLLEGFDLHTQWLVQLHFPDGSEAEVTASIEEVSRPAESAGAVGVETRALLLTQEGVGTVPAGTLVYLREQQDPFAT